MADRQVDVKPQTVFVVRCRMCGFNEQSRFEDDAERLANEHQARHDASRLIGQTIGGKVFHPGIGIGVIWDAAEAAIENGKPYVEWNGLIYESVGPNLSNPVAWAKDVVPA